MTRSLRMSVLLPALIVAGCTAESAENGVTRELGATARLGEGDVSTYADFDPAGVPLAIGVRFSEQSLQTLPAEMSDMHHCFDRNADGAIQSDAECLMTHERVVPLPTDAARRGDIPFKWVLLNWNPMGHVPPGIYDLPHFDIHFYTEPVENIMALESGPCGPEFIRCDQFEIARKPLPANYLPPDYQNFDAIVPAMGNHLIDGTSPELHGERFTRTWIYGTYDGRTIFQEEMITKDFLTSKPDTCFSIKQPPAVEVGGYYPTLSCTRFDVSDGSYTVSMEGFQLREGQAPVETP